MQSLYTLYGKNIRSQFGEDGILAYIFEKIGVVEGYCVEFGAWDAEYLSNSWTLWHDKGWGALLIEGDGVKVNESQAKIKPFPKVKMVEAFIMHEGENRLDAIMKRNNVPLDFDFLSVDVDGNDYHIWKHTVEYKPKVVCIEFNPTFPPHISFADAPGDAYMGCSARALVELATEKGYSLVAVTPVNCIFVRNDLFSLVGVTENSLEKLFLYTHNTFVIQSIREGTAYVLGQTPYIRSDVWVGLKDQVIRPTPTHLNKAGYRRILLVDIDKMPDVRKMILSFNSMTKPVFGMLYGIYTAIKGKK